MQPRDFSLYGAVDLGARQAADAAQAAGGTSHRPSPAARALRPRPAADWSSTSTRNPSTPTSWERLPHHPRDHGPMGGVVRSVQAALSGAGEARRRGGRPVDTWPRSTWTPNPQLSAALQVQSIPMVVAVIGGHAGGRLPRRHARGSGPAVDRPGPGGRGEDGHAGVGFGRRTRWRRGRRGRRPPRGSGRRPHRRPTPMPARPWNAGTWTQRPGRSSRNWRLTRPTRWPRPGWPRSNLIRRVSSYDQAKARRDAAERPGDVEAQARVADIDMATGRIEEAFNRLLGVVRRTSGEERDQARVHLVGLFELFPPNDPQVRKARSDPVLAPVLRTGNISS